MPNRLLLALTERSSIRKLITNRAAIRPVIRRFVAGETIDDGIDAGIRLKTEGIESILDYLGENVTDERQADQAAQLYIEILDRLSRRSPTSHISVKLTQLGLDLSMDHAIERMEKICAKAAEVNTTVAIDMESHEYTDRTIESYRTLRKSFSNLVLCLQAYLRRTEEDVAGLLPIDPSIRLCKGAYNEPKEIGLSRRETREAFVRTLEQLMTNCSYTAVATHDDVLVEETLRISRERRVPPSAYEFQMLYGVRRDLQRLLADQDYAVRVYIPFGDEWYAYLMRRLAERPANLRLFLEALLRG